MLIPLVVREPNLLPVILVIARLVLFRHGDGLKKFHPVGGGARCGEGGVARQREREGALRRAARSLFVGLRDRRRQTTGGESSSVPRADLLITGTNKK